MDTKKLENNQSEYERIMAMMRNIEKSSDLRNILCNCIFKTKSTIKQLLLENNNKIVFEDCDQVPIIAIWDFSGEIDEVWCKAVELDVNNLKILLSNGEYLDGEPISCDWLDILETIENTLNDK